MRGLLPILAVLLLAAPALGQTRNLGDANWPWQFEMVNADGNAMAGLEPNAILLKNGGTWAIPAGALSDKGHGIYQIACSAADVDTMGPLALIAYAPGAQAYRGGYFVGLSQDANLTDLGALLVSARAAVWEANQRIVGFEANQVLLVNFVKTLLDANMRSIAAARDPNLADIRAAVATAITAILGNDANRAADLRAYLGLTVARIDANIGSRMTMAAEANIAALVAGSTGSGTNATVVWVVDANGGAAIQGAKVRATYNTDTTLLTTLADGNVRFTLGTYTYTLAASSPGYDGNSVTKAIAAEANQTIKLNRVVVPAATQPDQCAVHVTFYYPDGNVAAGQVISYTLKTIPAGSGVAYIGVVVSATSNGSGVASAILWRGAVYEAQVRNVKVGADITVPAAATYTLPSIKTK